MQQGFPSRPYATKTLPETIYSPSRDYSALAGLPGGAAGDLRRQAAPATLAPAGYGGYVPRASGRAARRPGNPFILQGASAGMAGKGTIQAERLKSLIERIERLEEERSALTADIREVYAEAKSAGYDTKVMRQIVRLRKMDTADRQEQQALLDVYMQAVGLAG